MDSVKQSGRPPGTRNRNVVNARRAIADFVESNIPRFNDWLALVANGIPKRDEQTGRVLVDSQGSIVYVVKPDPAQALKLVADVCEYHLPRLSRADVAVVGKVEHRHLEPDQMNAEQLQRALFEHLCIGQQEPEGEIIDVTPEPVAAEQKTPDWLK